MLTTSCPKCEKEVTVPTGAGPESRVRCPLCSEEYSLESVFADLPPLLELLDAPKENGAAVESKPGGMFDFDGDEDKKDADDGDIALADAEEVAPKSSGFDFGDESATATATASSSSPARTKARPRKKQGSPVKMIVGVVIGGLLAGPIAQLILWWLPGNWDITQQDPLGIARDYPDSFGILAPADIRNYKSGNSGGEETDDRDTSSRPTNEGRENLADASDTSLGRDDLTDALHGTNSGQNGNGQSGTSDGGNGANQGNSGSGNSRPKGPGVINAPTIAPQQLIDRLAAANDALPLLEDATSGTGGGDPFEKIDEFVAAAAQLGQATAFVSERDASVFQQVKPFMSAAAGTQQKRRFVNPTSQVSLKDPDSDMKGIIISGVIDEQNKTGQLHETVVRIDVSDDVSANPPVSVYSKARLNGLKPGDLVVFLGAIISNPKESLRGAKASAGASHLGRPSFHRRFSLQRGKHAVDGIASTGSDSDCADQQGLDGMRRG